MTSPRIQSIARMRFMRSGVAFAEEIGDGVARAVLAVAAARLEVAQRGLDALERLAIEPPAHLVGAVGEVLQHLLQRLLQDLLPLIEVRLAQLLQLAREDRREVDLLPRMLDRPRRDARDDLVAEVVALLP